MEYIPIFVEKYDKEIRKINYPAEGLPSDMFVGEGGGSGNLLFANDGQYKTYKANGFHFDKMETLTPAYRYVRGLINHKGTAYVFTARVNLAESFGVVDFEKLAAYAVNKVKLIVKRDRASRLPRLKRIWRWIDTKVEKGIDALMPQY